MLRAVPHTPGVCAGTRETICLIRLEREHVLVFCPFLINFEWYWYWYLEVVFQISVVGHIFD